MFTKTKLVMQAKFIWEILLLSLLQIFSSKSFISVNLVG